MIKKLLFTIALAAVAAVTAHGRVINIHGVVTMSGSGEPLAGVTIFNEATNRLVGMTDDDGRYLITAESDASLLFTGMSTKDAVIPIDGRLEINVSLMPEANELEEVVVMAKSTRKGLITEPADLDVEGNYLRLKTKVKIPQQLFNSESRMIIQPAIYNVTRRHLSFLTPVVYDGWRYADTQERMYDWDKTKDPLTLYQQIKTTGKKDENIIYLIDSLYVENPNEDFMCAIVTSLEDYNRIKYADTLEIARGTVNPLRFLKYSLNPMSMTENQFLPTPEVELRDASGEMNLVFPVGKSKLDLTLGNNASELSTLIQELKTIENAPDMALKSFKIFGYASPEGSYETNKRLASERVNSAMESVLRNINESIRRNAEISSEADVADWSDVVALMRADGRNDEADKIQSILDRYTGREGRTYAIMRLPFYKDLIVEQYLPRLRRVSYHVVSSRYRPLTDEEIKQIYVTNPNGMSKYQFYRYYNSLDSADREPVIRKALQVHPDFVVAATDLSEIMLKRDENPSEILQPFLSDPAKWSKLPIATRYNMAVAAMADNRYSLADSLLYDVPSNPDTHKAKVYCSALNGHYREVVSEISKDSRLNEVLLLLAIKDNTSAWRCAQNLGNTAVEEYVKAVAANRLDDYLTATTHLENAFRLDPSLKEIAKVDGDIVDLLEEEDLNTDDDNNNKN